MSFVFLASYEWVHESLDTNLNADEVLLAVESHVTLSHYRQLSSTSWNR